MAKEQSLVSQNSLPNLAVAVRDTEVMTGGGVPFIGFATSKSGNIDELKAAGINPGDAYLSEGPVLLKPFMLFLVDFYRCWCESNDSYEPLSVVEEKPEDKFDPHRELIESVVLVLHKEKLHAATCTWRGPRCYGLHAALKELQDMDENWGKKSPEHKTATKIDNPSFRFITQITPTLRTSKSSGRQYVDTRGKVRPINTGEIAIFEEFYANGGGAEVDACMSVHSSKVAELRELI